MLDRIRSKRVTILGKSIPAVLLALLLMAGVGSATLVSYLSGMFTGTVDIESPIELKIYDDEGALISSDFGTMYGGDSILFSKIAYNNAGVDIPFAIVVIFKDTDGEGITVTSAGPCGTYGSGQTGKCVDSSGIPAPINDACWCQDLTSELGYEHGLCSDGQHGAQYDDTMTVWVGGTQYYVVTFGDQIDDVAQGQNAVITRLGYGIVSGGVQTCYSDPGDEKTTIGSNAYDTGTIKIKFESNIAPQGHEFRARVVAPQQTVGDIINEMFP